MANDVVDLLRSCNAWLDPNLTALLPGGESKRNRLKRDKNKSDEPETVDSNATNAQKKKKKSDSNDMLVMEDSEDEFADLAPNRIVLKRASHVTVDSDEENEGGS